MSRIVGRRRGSLRIQMVLCVTLVGSAPDAANGRHQYVAALPSMRRQSPGAIRRPHHHRADRPGGTVCRSRSHFAGASRFTSMEPRSSLCTGDTGRTHWPRRGPGHLELGWIRLVEQHSSAFQSGGPVYDNGPGFFRDSFHGHVEEKSTVLGDVLDRCLSGNTGMGPPRRAASNKGTGFPKLQGRAATGHGDRHQTSIFGVVDISRPSRLHRGLTQLAVTRNLPRSGVGKRCT